MIINRKPKRSYYENFILKDIKKFWATVKPLFPIR